MGINDPILDQFLRFPVINSALVDRKRLLNLIESNLDKKLILLSAPAGYGKTSLINQFISTYINFKIVYITGSRNLSSPYKILKIIFYLISKLLSAYDDNFMKIINEYEKSDIQDDNVVASITEKIILKLKENPEFKFILILDDFHIIDKNKNNNRIDRILKDFIDENLSNLTIIVSGRENPSFNVSYLKAKRLLFSINDNYLKFNKNEIIELSKVCYNEKISDDAADYLEQKFNGWVAILHLIFQKGKNWYYEIDIIKSEEIFPYFAYDIVTDWDAEITEFINKTSILENFTSEEADFLLDRNNSYEIIKILKNKNIFLETNRDSVNNEYYSYSKIFKDYLRNIFIPKNEDLYISEKAALIYKSRNNFPDYLRFSFISGKEENIFSEFSIKSIVYICTNNFSEYENCIKILTEYSNNPEYTLLNEIRLNKAKGIKTELPEFNMHFKQKFNNEFKLLLVEHYLSGNLYLDAIKILDSIDLEKEDFIFRNYVELLKARAYYRYGEEFYKKTTETCNKLIDKDLPDFIRKDALLLLANVYKNTGKLDIAIHFYENSLNYSVLFSSNIKIIGNLIDLYSMTGRYEKAYLHLSELNKNTKDFKIPSIISVTLRAQINFYRNIGDFNTAIELLFKSIEIEDISKNDLLIAVKYLEIVQAYYDSGSIDNCAEIFELAVYHYKKCVPVELFDILFNYFNLLINCNTSDFEKTEIAILNTIEWHKRNNILKPLGIFYFNLTELYIKNHKNNSASIFIKEAFDNLKKQMNYSFLENCVKRSRIVFDFAVSHNIAIKIIKDSVDGLLSKYQLNVLNDDFKKKCAEEINELYDLLFVPFGKTEIYLRGELVTDDKWIRKKSKILLAYLMSDPEKIHTKDKIMDIFFDDMPADKADVVYHSAIYNIRTALKIYDIKSDKPKRSKDKTFDYNPQYILYEDKTLRLNHDFYYKSDNIEFEKHYNKTRLPALSNEEKITHSIKAIEMYKGDFLPGYYDSWCEELRVKYKNMYITLCEELIKMLEAEIRYDEVIQYSELLLKEDKLNDSTHISIINAYAKLGNIKMAKSRYEVMLKIYNDELGEKPQPKTLDLIKSILEKN